MAKKKATTRKKSVSAKRMPPKALPMPSSTKDEELLCKVSLVFAVFFV
jgi:hypothetical protein